MAKFLEAMIWGGGFGLGLIVIQFALASPLRIIIFLVGGFFLVSGHYVKAEGLEVEKTQSKYVKVIKAKGESYAKFKQAFAVSWRELKLDDVSEDGNVEHGKAFIEPLPVWDLASSCKGMQLYWFDLAEYKVLDNSGQEFEMGSGFTGSGGTKRFIFGLDSKTGKLKELFAENVIDFIGVESGVADCPQFLVEFSGMHFKKHKNNYDYGQALVSFDAKKARYKASRERAKVGGPK